MKEQNEHTDEFLRNLLSDYREMPSPSVWSGVEKALDNQKKRRRLFFWLFFSGTGTAIWIIWLSFFNMNSENHTGQKSLYESCKMASNTRININSTDSDESGLYPQKQEILTDSKKETSDITNQNSIHKKGYPSSKHQIGSINHSKTKAQVLISDNVENILSPIDIGEVHSTLIETKEESNELTNKKQAADIHENLSETLKNGHKTDTNTIPSYISSLQKSKNECRFVPFMGADLGMGGLGFNRSGSVNNTDVNLNNTDNSGNSNKNSNLYGSATVYGGFTFKNHLTFSAGIGYELLYSSGPFQIQFSGTGVSNNIEYMSETLPFGNVDINFQVNEFSSQIPGIEKGLVKFKSHYLQIPIQIGYVHHFKKLSLGVQAGPSLHVLLNQKANFINEDGSMKKLLFNDSNPINLSMGVEPRIGYSFGKFTLSASANFRYRFLNIWKNTETRIMPYHLSGSVGLQYHFGCR